MTLKTFLTVEQVADICRVTPWTVREWLKNKNHPLNGTKMGRSWLIPEENVKQYLEEKHG